jgi:ribose 5-phosphate isomerase B
VAFGTDEQTAMTDALVAHLEAEGHTVMLSAAGAEWPEVGRGVAETVAGGAAERGVVCCWTGTGVSIAANKVPGARAALCTDAETARGARRWNDANVVAIGLRLTSEAVACEIVDAFLAEPADSNEAPAIARVER